MWATLGKVPSCKSCAVQNLLRAPAPKPGGRIEKQRQLKQHHSSEKSLLVSLCCCNALNSKVQSACAPPGYHCDSPEYSKVILACVVTCAFVAQGHDNEMKSMCESRTASVYLGLQPNGSCLQKSGGTAHAAGVPQEPCQLRGYTIRKE